MRSFAIMYVVIVHNNLLGFKIVYVINRKFIFFSIKLTFISSHEAKHVYLIGGFATHEI